MPTLLPIWAATGVVQAPDSTKISVGWELGEKPPHEYMNWWQQEMVERINHVLLRGIPEWDGSTTYDINALTLSGGIIYKATSPNTNSPPPSVNWSRVSESASALTAGTLPSARFSGNYTHASNITLSNTLTAAQVVSEGGVTASGSVTAARYLGSPGSGNIIVAPASGSGANGTIYLRPQGAGDSTNQTTINQQGRLSAVSFLGQGHQITQINASAIDRGTINDSRLPAEMTLKIFAHTSGTGIVVERRGNRVNSTIEYKTNEGSLFAGAADRNLWAVGTTSNLAGGGNRAFQVAAGNGDIGWAGNASGVGTGITNLNASNMDRGTLPSGRINGSYSMTNLTLSGVLQGGNSLAIRAAGAVNRVVINGDGLAVMAGGSRNARFGNSSANIDSPLTVSGNLRATGNVTADGSIVGLLNASQLNRGTVPNARISGSYTNFSSIVASGNIRGNRIIASNYGSQASPAYTFHDNGNAGMDYNSGIGVSIIVGGVRRLSASSTGITAHVPISGNGSGLTNLNAPNLTGTINPSRLPTNNSARDWVGARYAALAWNAIGSVIMATGPQRAIGATAAGSSLRVAGLGHVSTALVIQDGWIAPSSITFAQVVSATNAPGGTWMCCGVTSNLSRAATIWRRVS